MHHIHTTPGFIISSRPHGEAGKLLSIFTRDFGLVLAAAQGIRLEESKLRYHTQDYSLGSFSLVRGRELWRLTSAESSSSVGSEIIVRVAALLSRLLHGEEAHRELYEIIEKGTGFLTNETTLNEGQLKTCESVLVLRILHALGYIGNLSGLETSVTSELSVPFLDELALERPVINQHINKALRESQL